MKKLLWILVVIALVAMPLSIYARSIYFRSQGHTGGGNGVLDTITGTIDDDAAFVVLSDHATYGNSFFPYTLDVDGGTGDSVPDYVSAGDGGNERWELCTHYMMGLRNYVLEDDPGASTLTGTHVSNGIVTNDGAGAAREYELPAAIRGMAVTVFAEEDQDITVDPDDADIIMLIDGTALDAGDAIKSAAATNATGANVRLVAHDGTYWWVHSQTGVWIDDGP